MAEKTARRFSNFCWSEYIILPFDSSMAMESDDGWLQWHEEECIVIPKFVYCLLGLLWPIIRRIYNKPLKGQITQRIGGYHVYIYGICIRYCFRFIPISISPLLYS